MQASEPTPKKTGGYLQTLAARHKGARFVTPADDRALLPLVDRRYGARRDQVRFTPEAIYSVSAPGDAERTVEFMEVELSRPTRRQRALRHYPSSGALDRLTITDATACVGGNTAAFARAFRRVNAVEVDPDSASALRHNIALAGASGTVSIFNTDYASLVGRLVDDVVFIDPPWGGPGYRELPAGPGQCALRRPGSGEPVPLRELVSRLDGPVFLKIPKRFSLHLEDRPERRLALSKYDIIFVAPKLKTKRAAMMSSDGKASELKGDAKHDHLCGFMSYYAGHAEKDAPGFPNKTEGAVPINLCDPNENWGSIKYIKNSEGAVRFLNSTTEDFKSGWVEPLAGVRKVLGVARLVNVDRGWVEIQAVRPKAALESERLSGAQRPGDNKRSAKSRKKGEARSRKKWEARAPAGQSAKEGAPSKEKAKLPEAKAGQPERPEAEPQQPETKSKTELESALQDIPEGYALVPEAIARDAVFESPRDKLASTWDAVVVNKKVVLHGDELLRMVYIAPEPKDQSRRWGTLEGTGSVVHYSLDVYLPIEQV